jgi:hypothetical protein
VALLATCPWLAARVALALAAAWRFPLGSLVALAAPCPCSRALAPVLAAL